MRKRKSSTSDDAFFARRLRQAADLTFGPNFPDIPEEQSLPYIQRDPTGHPYHAKVAEAAALLHGPSKDIQRGQLLLQQASQHDCNEAQGSNISSMLDVAGLSRQRTVASALNELKQNLIDQAVKANRYKYDTLQIQTQATPNGQETLITNQQYKLAEICDITRNDRRVVEFVNYGTGPKRQVLLRYGKSTKTRHPNQIGCHGTGFKLACCTLLHQGFCVEVELMATVDYSRGGQRWKMREDDDGFLRVAIRRCVLEQRHPDRTPFHVNVDRFVVRVSFPPQPTPEEIAPVCLSDCFLDGEQVILMDKPGEIYVHRFKVQNLKNCLFGYNFTHLPVGQDRNRAGDEVSMLLAIYSAIHSALQLQDIQVRQALANSFFGFHNCQQVHAANLEFQAFCAHATPEDCAAVLALVPDTHRVIERGNAKQELIVTRYLRALTVPIDHQLHQTLLQAPNAEAVMAGPLLQNWRSQLIQAPLQEHAFLQQCSSFCSGVTDFLVRAVYCPDCPLEYARFIRGVINVAPLMKAMGCDGDNVEAALAHPNYKKECFYDLLMYSIVENDLYINKTELVLSCSRLREREREREREEREEREEPVMVMRNLFVSRPDTLCPPSCPTRSEANPTVSLQRQRRRRLRRAVDQLQLTLDLDPASTFDMIDFCRGYTVRFDRQ